MLKRGSIGSGPMGFEVPGFAVAVVRAREWMGCAGVAKAMLGSMSSSGNGNSLYMIMRNVIVLNYGIFDSDCTQCVQVGISRR